MCVEEDICLVVKENIVGVDGSTVCVEENIVSAEEDIVCRKGSCLRRRILSVYRRMLCA